MEISPTIKSICNSIGTTDLCFGCGASHIHYSECCEKCPSNDKAKCNLVYILKHNGIVFEAYKEFRDMINGESFIKGSDTLFKGKVKSIDTDLMRTFLERINSGWRNYNPNKLFDGIKLHKLNYIEHSFNSLMEILDDPTYLIIYKTQ
jgi:hypothetical protein